MNYNEPRQPKKKKNENEPVLINEETIDIYEPEGLNYPLIENLNNAITWPEGPKGRIDLNDTYEVSSVPEDPGTPMESVNILENKGVMPN